ncbi:MAG: ADP-ribosylation factor-like protein [Candidatus Heimdallarchaeota archaeon]
MKIGFLGLDGAGKTSFLLTLGKKFSAISGLKATKGIERDSINLLGLEISLWDFGGQQAYRERYISKTKDLEGLDVLFFVLDAQNGKRIDESIAYLESILTSAKDFDRNHLIVCLHKADPDFQRTANFGDNVDKIQEEIGKHVPEAYAFPWTSIFEERSIFSAFSMGLRMIASQKELVENWMQQLLDDTNCSVLLLITQSPYIIAKKAQDETLGYLCEKVGLALVGMDQTVEESPLACQNVIGHLKQGIYVLKSEKVQEKSYYLMLFSQYADSADAILENAKKSVLQLPDLLTALGT